MKSSLKFSNRESAEANRCVRKSKRVRSKTRHRFSRPYIKSKSIGSGPVSILHATMLLQIWVLPPSQAEATENSALLSHGAIAPAGSRTFLESCPANITLEQLCARICSRHDRIYPDRAYASSFASSFAYTRVTGLDMWGSH